MFPTISIITPSYNQGRFIEEAIQSVLGQEGNFSIDYIVVDGGSTDESLGIIRKYESSIKEGKWNTRCRGIRYRWISEEDKGQSNAINKGLKLAEGEIIAWLNSDDYYAPGAFSTACNTFEHDKSLVMLYGTGYTVDRNGVSIGQYDVEPFFDLWKLIHLYDFVLQPSVFMRKTALQMAGGVNEDLNYIMDWELWIRLSRFGRVCYCPTSLSYARMYAETKTGSGGLERWKEIKWCSRRYGEMKLPPVVITQLFHKPVQRMSGNGEPGHVETPFFFRLMRKIYYAAIGGNKSGILADGRAEKVCHISVPLRGEAESVAIEIEPLFPNTLRYFAGDRLMGSVDLSKETVAINIVLNEDMRRSGFLHIKFSSAKTEKAAGPQPGRPGDFAFRITDIFLRKSGGQEMRNIGLADFRMSPSENEAS